MFSRSWIVASLVALSVPVLPSASVNAVTYGDPVENPQIDFPEVVPVWIGGKSICSGTLIQQQVVLTAAHCVYGENGPFQISVGGSTLNNGRLIDVNATWYHPRYDAAFSQNDIALLHLKIPASVSRLGVLPKARMSSLGKKFLIVGWGRDQNGTITGKLHSLTLNDQTVASKRIFKNIYNQKTMIGAGKYFSDEILYGGGCTGDSGGPLYMGAKGASRTVIGLTSFGARGCTVYQPTVFTRVDFYVTEINKGIQLLNSRSATTPIASGKATSPGIGPTTTTTTAPLKPLSLKYLTDQDRTASGGLMGKFISNLEYPNLIKKICFILNAKPLPDYRYTNVGFLLNLVDTPTQSGGAGCYEGYAVEKVAVSLMLLRLPRGLYDLKATVFDNLGRSANSPTILFTDDPAGRNYLNKVTWPTSVSSRSRTGEIEISVTSSVASHWPLSNGVVTKVCYYALVNNSSPGAIRSGTWPKMDDNCVSNPNQRSNTNIYEYTSSGVFLDPSGIQNWGVYAVVYDDAGGSYYTSSLWFDS